MVSICGGDFFIFFLSWSAKILTEPSVDFVDEFAEQAKKNLEKNRTEVLDALGKDDDPSCWSVSR
jgi:hypothetical protein